MSEFDYEDIWQGGWNDTTKYGPSCRHRRRIVGNMVKCVPHETVLDLGCGDGALLAEMSQRIDAQFLGSDISEHALDIARNNVPDIPFVQLDLGKGVPDGTFDVVVMSEVLEHIEDDEAVMRKVAPITKHIVISVPGGPADKVDKRFGHFRNYDGDLLKRKLQANGFDVVYFRRWGVPFYELTQLLLNSCTEDAAAAAGGKYSPMKKFVANTLYIAFFLNVLPMGSQVFAIGRSRTPPKETAQD